MSTTKQRNTIAIGPVRTDIHVGIGFAVKPPKWSDDPESRILEAQRLTITEHDYGVAGTYIIRLDGKPLVSLNADAVEALGLALIRAK